MQVRQHVSHKRTFMFLEQLIVKHGAHEQCLNIKECHQGLDFYFGNRSHAQKFVDFLQVLHLCFVVPRLNQVGTMGPLAVRTPHIGVFLANTTDICVHTVSGNNSHFVDE